MAENFYTILTSIGQAKIANAQVAGQKVNLTEIAVGDGGGSYYNPDQSQIALKNEVWRGNISAVQIDEENPNWIIIEGVIPSSVGGFFVREVGIFDEDGDMVAVGKFPETYKPRMDEGSAKDLYLRMIIEVTNTSTVQLKVDPSTVMASKQFVNEQVAKVEQKSNQNTAAILQIQQQLNETATTIQTYIDQRVNDLAGEGRTTETIKQNAENIANLQQTLDAHLAEGAHIPRGVIVMWSGSVDNIPAGWALCDGTNGTPDLRDRFIVGAGNEYSVGDTGGAKEVTLTVEQLPVHSHSAGTLITESAGSHSHGSGTLATSTTGSHNHSFNFGGPDPIATSKSLASGTNYGITIFSSSTGSSGSHSHTISGSTSSDGSHSHTISGNTGSAGGDQAHENRPPYYALAFIMKL